MSVFFDPDGNVVDRATAFSAHGMTKSKSGLRVEAPAYQQQAMSPRQVIVVRQTPSSPTGMGGQYISNSAPATWSEPVALPQGMQVKHVYQQPRQVSMQSLMQQGTPGAGALALASGNSGGGTNIMDMLIKANQNPRKAAMQKAEDAEESARRQEWEALRTEGTGRSAPPQRQRGGDSDAKGGKVWVRKTEMHVAPQPQHRPATMPPPPVKKTAMRLREDRGDSRKPLMRLDGPDKAQGDRSYGGYGGTRRR